MYLNTNFISFSFKNSIKINSTLLIGVFKNGLFSGRFSLVILAFSTAFFRTSGRSNEDDVFNFSAICLIISLFSFVFPCLICNPFKALS